MRGVRLAGIWESGRPRKAMVCPTVTMLVVTLATAQTSDLVAVISKPVSRTLDLPAEIQPYLAVALHAKVAGYVDRMLVDRGSMVKQGDLLVELSAPEMAA